MSDELPNGWASARLVELLETLRDGTHTPPARVAEGVPLISARNIQNGRLDWDEPFTFISRKDFEEISRTNPVKKGDVFLTIVGTIGRTCVNELDREFTVQRSVAIARPRRDCVVSHYLSLAFRSPRFQKLLQDMAQGSAQRGAYLAPLKQASVPLAPLGEQRRIVAKLETLLGKVDASQQRLGKIPILLKRFRQSVLAAACSGRLTADWREERKQDDEWPTAKLRAVVQTLDQGWSPKCDIQASPSPKFWGVIKTTAVQAMGFLEHENKRLPDALQSREELELKAGDMLITRAGPRARAGVCCLVRSVRPRLMACDKVYRFRINELVAKAEFIELVLNAPKMVEEIDTLKTGISDSGVNLTQEKFLALEFELPPLPEQQEIVRRVEGLFALADQLEERLAKARGQVEKLTPSLLARAFAGRLVPQDPTDEPASILINRIKQKGYPHGPAR